MFSICSEVASRSAHGLEADVWSVGCMLYTLLVGHPPFDTQGVKNTLNRVISAEFELPDSLSPEAKDLICHLLKKNPKERLPLDSKCCSVILFAFNLIISIFTSVDVNCYSFLIS